MTFDLHYGATPSVEPTVVRELTTPPALRLLNPEPDTIDFVVEPSWDERTVVSLGDNGAQFFDLWFWSLAVAWGLLPAAVPLDTQAHTLWLWAQPEPDGRLQLGLMRADGDEPFDKARALAGIRWREPRADLVRRLGAMWDAILPSAASGEAPAHEANGRRWRKPWLSVAEVPSLEPPPWPLPARVAWFYLLLVRHVEFGRFSEAFADDPVGWTLSLLKGESFALDATQAAWSMLFDDDPPGEEAVRQIQSVCDAVRAGQEGFRAANKRELFQACMQVSEACVDAKAAIVQAIRPRLPMARGSHVADGQGRRAVVIDVRGGHALLYWEDGRITREQLLAACDGSNWRWPVAHGPRFDNRASLDPIDQRRLRCWELDASPVDIVCPVCGYPSTDDVWIEVQDCDVCGFGLDEAVNSLLAEDLTETDDGQWLTPRLNEARERFRRTTWSGPEDEDVDPESYRARMRDPRYRVLVRAYMAEWDAWLNEPDPERKPLEMWRRWNRLRGYPD